MAQMNILVIGSGGREHALAWALSHSPQASRIYVAPGNAGTARDGFTNVSLGSDDIPALREFALSRQIDLTVVGPEVPLAQGIVDQFQTAGLRIFGPVQVAAQLESSKAFAKQFMVQHGIPTAQYASFDAYQPAVEWVRAFGKPVVVKADGLAAGKGVIICDDVASAEAALHRAMVDGEFGSAGHTIVLEERLTGPELSVLAFSDGHTAKLMPAARDHKRVFDGDAGPNTGGMGAFSPVPGIDQSLIDEILHTVIQPAIDGMVSMGTPYVGVLYAGMMLTPSGPKTLEFNCRFGDPETQAILPLLKSDLLAVLLACTNGTLQHTRLEWYPGYCATVVLASAGYPGPYPKGRPITGLSPARDQPGVKVFHAGSEIANDQVVTSGGRVLAVSALGADLPSALDHAYAAVADIHFDGAHYRKDIGKGQV